MEDGRQHRADGARPLEERRRLVADDSGADAAAVLDIVEEVAAGAAETERIERHLDRLVLNERPERRQRPLRGRPRREILQRVGDLLLLGGARRQTLLGEAALDKLEGPGELGRLVDERQGLQADRGIVGRQAVERAAERQADAERRGSPVEDDDAGAPIFAVGGDHRAEQHALPCPGLANDERVADVGAVLVQRQPEGRAAVGQAAQQGRSVQVPVALGSGPDRRRRQHFRKGERAGEEAAEIALGVTGLAAVLDNVEVGIGHRDRVRPRPE